MFKFPICQQVPIELYQFPEYLFKEFNPSWKVGDFVTGPEVQEYIQSYVQKFALDDKIFLNTKVPYLPTAFYIVSLCFLIPG